MIATGTGVVVGRGAEYPGGTDVAAGICLGVATMADGEGAGGGSGVEVVGGAAAGTPGLAVTAAFAALRMAVGRRASPGSPDTLG